MNRHQLEQMADFQPKNKREKSRWWYWAVIILGALLLAWILVQAGQNQENPGPPKFHKMRLGQYDKS